MIVNLPHTSDLSINDENHYLACYCNGDTCIFDIAYMLGYKISGIKNVCFWAGGLLVFSSWKVRKPFW